MFSFNRLGNVIIRSAFIVHALANTKKSVVMAEIITIDTIELRSKLIRNKIHIWNSILLYIVYGKGSKKLDRMSTNDNDGSTLF